VAELHLAELKYLSTVPKCAAPHRRPRICHDGLRLYQQSITTVHVIHSPKQSEAATASVLLSAYEAPKQRVGTARRFPSIGVGSRARLVAVFPSASFRALCQYVNPKDG
jgi:hypothetical protein